MYIVFTQLQWIQSFCWDLNQVWHEDNDTEDDHSIQKQKRPLITRLSDCDCPKWCRPTYFLTLIQATRRMLAGLITRTRFTRQPGALSIIDMGKIKISRRWRLQQYSPPPGFGSPSEPMKNKTILTSEQIEKAILQTNRSCFVLIL